MKYAVLLVSATAIFSGCWTEQEVVSNDTTDTDSDSDSDSDSDTDGQDTEEDDEEDEGDTSTDNLCIAPEGITDWGGPCHTTADCPPYTECLFLSGMDATQGFCAAECCNFSTPDTDYCTDVAAGEEGCIFGTSSDGINFAPPFYCIIICNTPADCPTGTDCVEAGAGISICYGYDS